MADLTTGNQSVIGNVQLAFSRVYTNLAVAIIILLAGVILGRIVGRFIHKVLEEIELNRFLKKTTGIKFAVDEIIANLITFLIYFLAIVMALDQIGLASPLLKLVSIAIIVVIIVSILLGIRDFFPNILSGIFIAQRRFLNQGDKVKVGGIEGEIIEVNIVETRIRTRNGDIIYIPNSVLAKKEVVKLNK
jgi:small conductance mechanosensitive channel